MLLHRRKRTPEGWDTLLSALHEHDCLRCSVLHAGSYAVNSVNGAWVADYVLGGYNTSVISLLLHV